MNVTLTTTPGRHDHPPQPPHTEKRHPEPDRPTRRVGMLDRLALHVGIALIKWGRRTRSKDRVDPAELFARQVEQRRAQAERDRVVNDAMHLPLRLR